MALDILTANREESYRSFFCAEEANFDRITNPMISFAQTATLDSLSHFGGRSVLEIEEKRDFWISLFTSEVVVVIPRRHLRLTTRSVLRSLLQRVEKRV